MRHILLALAASLSLSFSLGLGGCIGAPAEGEPAGTSQTRALDLAPGIASPFTGSVQEQPSGLEFALAHGAPEVELDHDALDEVQGSAPSSSVAGEWRGGPQVDLDRAATAAPIPVRGAGPRR